MKDIYRACIEHMKETNALASISGVLVWDQETMMPQRAVAARAEQSAALASIIHERFVDPAMGKLLKQLWNNADKLTAMQRANVRERMRDYEKSVRLPPDLVTDLARISSLSQHAWIDARKQSDFSLFAPWLKRMLALKHRQAEAYGYEDNPYDALLDDYEPACTVAELDAVMDELKAGLIPIVHAVLHAKKRIGSSALNGRYPRDIEEAACRDIMKVMGVDESGSRLDVSAHPFCAGISSPYDVRITISYDERSLPKVLSNVMHEAGHALYEQGLDEKHAGTPLGESLSLGIHESQSRLWENTIGRSRAFIAFLLPRLKKYFPQQLKGVRVEDFYRAINRVQNSPIRIEADEVTYSLHVVLRYELEKALLAKDLRVADLPGAWNELMKKYLAIVPRNDALGVLQDTHWASGLIGYFPTYLLGNLYAAQFWHKLCRDIRNTQGLLRKGNCAPILAWLRKHIHRHGRRYTAAELVKRATGKHLSAIYFLDYIKDKYGDLYGISW